MAGNGGKNKLKLNLGIGIAYQVLTIAINFFSKQAIRYQLGTDYLGIQTVYGNICDVLIFAFAGVGLAMVYRLYGPFDNEDKGLVNAVFHFFDKVYRILTVIAASLGVVATVVVLWSINADIATLEVVITYLLYLAGILVYNRYIIYYYFLMGDQRRYISCIVYGVLELVTVIVSIALLVLFQNYAMFLCTILAKNVILRIVLGVYCHKRYPYLWSKERQTLDPDAARQVRKDIKDMVISNMGNILVYSTDAVLISGLVSTSMAGFYSSYYFLFSGVILVVNGIAESVMSRIGQILLNSTRVEGFRAFTLVCGINVVLTSICVCGFWVLADDFVTLWMGPEVVLPVAVTSIMAVNLHMNVARRTASVFRLSAGLFARVSWVGLLRGVLNVIVSIVLGMRFGLIGILISTTITDITTLYWFEALTTYRYFKKSFLYEVFYQVAGAVVVLLCVYLSSQVSAVIAVDGWLTLIAKGLIVVIVAVVCSSVMVGVWYWLVNARRRDVMAALEDERVVNIDQQALKALGPVAVSFVVPIYNEEQSLRACVESVCKLQDVPFEVILVDDCSTDGTPGVCAALAAEDDRVRALRLEENSGQGVARNAGVAAAHGAYIFFVDADDEVCPSGISSLLTRCMEYDLDVACGMYRRFDGKNMDRVGTNAPCGFVSRDTDEEAVLLHKLAGTNAFGYVWNKLYRRDFLRRVGVQFASERGVYMEDTLFNLQVIAAQPRYWLENVCTTIYNVSGETTTHRPNADVAPGVARMLTAYGDFLRDDQRMACNEDLLVPLVMRMVCWSAYIDVYVLRDAELAERNLDMLIALPVVAQTLAKEENAAWLDTLQSKAQTIFFKYCFKKLRTGDVHGLVGMYKFLDPFMRGYIDTAVK